MANVVAGQESDVDEVRALAHSRPQTMLTLVLALVGAVLGGLQLLGLWGVGGLGDWDWRGLCYVVPLAGAQPPNSELFQLYSSELIMSPSEQASACSDKADASRRLVQG